MAKPESLVTGWVVKTPVQDWRMPGSPLTIQPQMEENIFQLDYSTLLKPGKIIVLNFMFQDLEDLKERLIG